MSFFRSLFSSHYILLSLLLCVPITSSQRYLQVSRPTFYGPYFDDGTTMPFILSIAELAGFVGGNSSVNYLLNATCTSSSTALDVSQNGPCWKALDGRIGTHSHSNFTPPQDREAWLRVFFPPSAPLLTAFTLTPRQDCCWGRAQGSSFDLVDSATGKVLWGEVLPGSPSPYAPFSFTLPTLTIRVSGPGSQMINFLEIAAYSAGSTVNRLLGQRCRSSSTWSVSPGVFNDKCTVCTDGRQSSCIDSYCPPLVGQGGCDTSATDAAPWMVFSLVGTDPVGSIVIQPRATFYGRTAALTVEVINVSSGGVLWSGSTAALNLTSTTTASDNTVGVSSLTQTPILLPVTAPPPPQYLLRIWKPASEGPYWNDGNGNPQILHIAEVRAFDAQGGLIPLAASACVSSSQDSQGGACSLGADGNLLTFSHSSYSPTMDENPLIAFPLLAGGRQLATVEITPRQDCCFGRLTAVALELIVGSGLASWGVMAGSGNSASAFNTTLPLYTLRISSGLPQTTLHLLNFEELQVFSVNGTLNRLLGAPCRSSSTYPGMPCRFCVDGALASSQGGCSVNLGDTDPWLLFNIAGSDPVGSIVIHTRATVGLRGASVGVQVLQAATGGVVWAGSSASVYTSGCLLTVCALTLYAVPPPPPPPPLAPLTLAPSSVPLQFQTLRIWKPAMEGVYAAATAGNPFILHFAEVTAHSAGWAAGGAATNLLLGAPCTNSIPAAASDRCSAGVDGNSATGFHSFYSPTADLNPLAAYYLYNTPPLSSLSILPRQDCCFDRFSVPGISLELLVDAGPLPSWGEVIPGAGTTARVSIALPLFTILLQQPAPTILNFEEVSAFSSPGSGNVLLRPLTGGGCRSSSVFATPGSKCSIGNDGSIYSAEGFATAPTDTPISWAIYSVLGSTPPSLIILQPRIGVNSFRSQFVNVTLQYAATGQAVWSGTTAGGYAGSRPILLNVSAPPPPIYGIRVRKSTLYSPSTHPSGLDPNSYILHLASVRAFANASGGDMLLGAPCTQSSMAIPGSSCSQAVDGNVNTHSHSMYAPLGAADLAPFNTFYVLGGAPVGIIEVTPRQDGNWWRGWNLTVEVVTNNSQVSWGGVFNVGVGQGGPAPFNVSLTLYSVRLSGVPWAYMVFSQVIALSYGGGAAAANRLAGQPCMGSSTWSLASRCEVCTSGVDRGVASPSGCANAATSDDDPWFVFAVAGTEPVASIVLVPRAPQLGYAASVKVQLLYAATGQVLWEQSTPSTITSPANITFILAPTFTQTPSSLPSPSLFAAATSSPAPPTHSPPGAASASAGSSPSPTVCTTPTVRATPSSPPSPSVGVSSYTPTSSCAPASPSTSVSPRPSLSHSPSGSPSLSSAATPSATPTATPTGTSSLTLGASSSVTPTPTPSQTLSGSATPSLTPSPTSLPAASPSTTPSPTPSLTPSPLISPSSLGTVTPTPSPTTSTPPITPTASPSLTSTPSATATLGSSGSVTGSNLPSPSPSPSSSPSPSGTTSPTPTPTPSATTLILGGSLASNPSPTPSSTPTPTSTVTPTSSSSSSGVAGIAPITSSTTTLSGSGTVSSSPTSSLTRGASPSVSASPSTTPSGTLSASSTASLSRGAPPPSLSPTASTTLTSSSSASPSGTGSNTPSGTGTFTTPPLSSGSAASTSGSNSPISSPTQTPTASVSHGASGSTSSTNSLTASPTATPTASVSQGLSASTSSTSTLSASPSQTPSSSITLGASPSTSSTNSLTSSPTPTPSSSVTLGASASTSSTATLSASPTSTPTSSLSQGASSSSSSTSTLTRSPSATPTSSLSKGASSSSTSTSSLTSSPTTTPSSSLSVGLSPSSTSTSSLSGSPTSSPTPSLSVGSSPSTSSTATLSASPTGTPRPALSQGAPPSTSSPGSSSINGSKGALATSTPSPSATFTGMEGSQALGSSSAAAASGGGGLLGGSSGTAFHASLGGGVFLSGGLAALYFWRRRRRNGQQQSAQGALNSQQVIRGPRRAAKGKGGAIKLLSGHQGGEGDSHRKGAKGTRFSTSNPLRLNRSANTDR